MARSPRSARTRDGAVARSSAARWQGATGELVGATGRPPGKAVRGGAHPSSGAMERQQRMLRAARFKLGFKSIQKYSNGSNKI
jgi:hypothetical protein